MKTIYITAIAAAALVLSGCNRDEIVPGASSDGYLKLEVAGIQTVTAVKGTLINNEGQMHGAGVDNFMVAAWNNNTDCTGFVSLQEATYEDSKWSLTPSVKWTGEDTKTFFAYANLPTGATVDNTFKSDDKSQKLAITSLPTDARNQNDIMLGYYSGDGKVDGKDAHTAQIQFYHPLTAVKICDGGIIVDAINKITLSGIYASGTVDVTYKLGIDGKIAPEYDWGTTRTSYTSATLKPKSGDKLEINPVTKVIGVPFVVIPQDIVAGKVRITLDVTIDEEPKTLAVDVPATTWTAGHTKSYILRYGVATNWALTVIPWDAGVSGGMELSESIGVTGDVLRNYDNTEGPVSYSITSEYPWKLQYTLDGTTWTDAVAGQAIGESGNEWVSFDVVSGTGNGVPATVTATVMAASGSTETLELNHNKALREASPRGVESNPWDLSMHDIYGNFNASGRTTANCYVVSAPGWYSFPLVYGNAIKDGEVNTEAFAPEAPAGTDEKLYLTPFKKADGNGISSPYITGATKAWPLWEDVLDYAIINNTAADCKIVGTGTDAKVVFHVNQATLTQGNVVIAVSNGTDILWSWHIWVTDADLTPIPVKNYYGATINMFPRNLGWVDAAVKATATGYPAMSLDIRFVQTGGDKGVITKTVRRKEYIIENTATTEGSGPTWQHGRKDPFIRSNGRTNDELTAFSGTPVDLTKSASVDSGCDIAFGIKDPNFFVIQGDGDHHQWYIENNDYDYQYLNLWSALTTKDNKEGYQSKPVKTVYDPCPPGFQIPQGDAFTGFITTDAFFECKDATKFNVVGAYSNGWNFKTGLGDKTIVFPSAGVRRADSGILKYAGGAGCYWAAIPLCIIRDANTNVSVGLQFQSGEVSPIANHKRSLGYTVRPAQE